MYKLNIKKMSLEYINLSSLKEFQEDIKFLAIENNIKLKKVLNSSGLQFPFFAYKENNNNFLIDGHQRLKVLKEEIKEDLKVPVIFINFNNIEEAKKAILLVNSHYGDFRYSKLEDFFSFNNINDDFIFNLNIKDNSCFDFSNSENFLKNTKEFEIKESILNKEEVTICPTCKRPL